MTSRASLIIYRRQLRTMPGWKTSGARLKMLERATGDRLPPMRRTQRDLAIICAVYEYRVLTAAQIEMLLFTPTPGRPYSRKKRCQARLRLLFDYKFLGRSEQSTRLSEGRRPLIYTLDSKGIELLADELKLEREEIKKRSNPLLSTTSRLRHLLKTNDVRIAIILAARQQDVEIIEWLDDYELHRDYDKVTITGPRGGEQEASVIPDGYFWLWTGKNNYHQFLEVDLRTVVGQYSQEGRKDWARRVRAYKEYYRSDLYRQRYPSADKSMRVLTVTTGEIRLRNLKEITEKVAGKDYKRFWFTTFERLNSETVLTAPIWQIAMRKGLYSLIW